MKQKKRCLVTGAAGGIGFHLCERLLSAGHEVIGLDDFSIGRNQPRCEVWAHDVGGEQQLLKYPFDWIFHLAGRADLIPSIRDPLLYHRVNVTGTVNMLEYARSVGASRFIYAASSSCYGANPEVSCGEMAKCLPAHPYAVSKYLGELWALAYNRVYKVPTVSLRLFNVYGPKFRTANYGAVFGTFMAQWVNGKPLTVVGDGGQQRDFVHVYDVCDALIRAAKSDELGEVFNICSGEGTSVMSLANEIGGEVRYVPKRPGEPYRIVGSRIKAFKRLRWAPTISLTEGIADLKTYAADYADAPVWTPDTIAQETKDWFSCLES